MAAINGSVLGERIRYYRNLRGLTQEALAERVGVAATHITNIERGNKGVSLYVLQLICRELSIGLTNVLPDEDKRDDAEVREKLVSEVVDVMNALDADRLEVVRTMVGALRG